MNIQQRIEHELPSLVELRHDLHAHPELSYHEERTSRVVQRELASAGVEFRAGIAGTGDRLRASSGSGGSGAPISFTVSIMLSSKSSLSTSISRISKSR